MGSQPLITLDEAGGTFTARPTSTVDLRGRVIGLRPGTDYFVDKDLATASDTNDGLSWQQALLTVQAGVDKTVTGLGDHVFVKVAASAYAENVIVASKDYVSIVGVLNNSAWGRPDIHPAAGIGLVVTLSQGFLLQNVYVFSDDDDAMTIDSEGWRLENCKFQGSSDGLLLKGHPTNDSFGAGQGLARGCTFEANGAAGIRMEHADATSGIGSTDNEIVDCLFRDNTGVDLLSAVGVSGGGAGIFLRLSVRDCKFLDPGAAHVYIDMDQGVANDLTANSGMFSNNFFADDAFVAAQADISGQPNVFFVGNYDAAGLIDGSTFND